METQTYSRPLNVTMLIREMNSYEKKPINVHRKPKVFPYLEKYHNNSSPKDNNFSLSPSNLASLYMKVSKNKYKSGYSHTKTFDYDTSKLSSAKFIEKVRNEVDSDNDFKQQKHVRSSSEMFQSLKNHRKKLQSNGVGNLVIIPALKFPENIKRYKERRTSVLRNDREAGKLDIPYLQAFQGLRNAAGGYFGDFEHVTTREISINTNL